MSDSNQAVIRNEEGGASTLPMRATGDSIARVLAIMEDAEKFAEKLARSQFIPQAFRGNSADVLAAVTLGQMVGLNPMQALWGIAVINGRPCIWGDAALAIVRSHPDFEDIQETIEKSSGEEGAAKAICTIKRRGQSPVARSFSMAQAQRAGLSTKKGPWTDYPARMLQMRARGFAMRDAFADALTGMMLREEAEDAPPEPRDVTPPPASLPEGKRIRMTRRQRTEEASTPEKAHEPAPAPAAQPPVDPGPPPPADAQAPPEVQAEHPREKPTRADLVTHIGLLASQVPRADLDAYLAEHKPGGCATWTAIEQCRYLEPLTTVRDALARWTGAPPE